jgi:predicted dehydrogenase
MSKTVAVVGASGIGKHHANWWNTEGASVCGFVGTSTESVMQTLNTLVNLFTFEGRGYTDLEELIDQQDPDIVDICSPPRFHYEHAMTAIEAGCDVLCEKPFIYEDDVPDDELLDQARTVVAEAQAAGVLFGLCSQYHVSADACGALLAEHGGEEQIEAYRGHIASPAGDRGPDPVATWIDLAPHMLAGMQALFPRGRIDFTTLSTQFAGYNAQAEFDLQLPDGRTVDCQIVTGRTTEESDASNVRRYELNGSVFDIGGTNDENGVYCAEYHTPWGTRRHPDPMRLLIRDFLAGTPRIDGPAALTNLTWLLRIKAEATI